MAWQSIYNLVLLIRYFYPCVYGFLHEYVFIGYSRGRPCRRATLPIVAV